MGKTTLLVSIFFMGCVGFSLQLTETEVAGVSSELVEFFTDATLIPRQINGIEIRRVIRGRLIPLFVRLAFHDCVGPNGCDGCINTNSNPANNGLSEVVAFLHMFHTEANGPQSLGMTFGDLIALAGITAAVEGARNGDGVDDPEDPNIPVINFQYNRTECETSPNTNENHAFPSGHGTFEATTDFFEEGYGLSVKQTVALLGAHSLGRTHIGVSGFRGPWTGDTQVLDNAYYGVMDRGARTRNGWIQHNVALTGDARWQWGRSNSSALMMLNADMCLARDIRVNEQGEEENATCKANVGECPESPGLGFVREYAGNNTIFISDFSEAFGIVISETNGNLQDPIADRKKKRSLRSDNKLSKLIQVLEDYEEEIEVEDILMKRHPKGHPPPPGGPFPPGPPPPGGPPRGRPPPGPPPPGGPPRGRRGKPAWDNNKWKEYFNKGREMARERRKKKEKEENQEMRGLSTFKRTLSDWLKQSLRKLTQRLS